jgi:hypothetical protein
MKMSMINGHTIREIVVSTPGKSINIYMVFGKLHHCSHGFGLQAILVNISFSSGCSSRTDSTQGTCLEGKTNIWMIRPVFFAIMG